MDKLGPTFSFYSSGPSRLWLWIIEYLSSFVEIDTSMIRAFIEEAPLLPNELDERTNERVALKCLEEIFGFKQGLKNAASPDSRTFDHSLSCQDVLNQILKEVPLSTCKRSGPELLKWYMWPFIMHKRGTLPKCKLEELKVSIMEMNRVLNGNGEGGNQEGSLTPQRTKMVYGEGGNLECSLNPQLTMKDYGEGGNQEGCLTSQRTTKDNGEIGNLVGSLTPRRTTKNYGEGGDKEGSLSPQITAKVNEDLQDRLPKDVLNGNGESGNHEGSLTQRTMMVYGEGGNQEGCTPQRTTKDNGENCDLLGSLTPQRTMKDYGEGGNKEGCLSPQITTEVNEDLQDRFPEDVLMVESYDVENSTLNKSPSADAGEIIDRGCQSSSLNSTSVDGFWQNIDPDMESFAEQLFENEDGGFNASLKKRLLLSLHCRPSQDTVGKTGSREQDLCVKCNQNGQLLVCSSSDCPVVVHESCLVSGASFDDKGHFYCPFCAYSISILEYLEAKDKTLLAGKNLAEFIELLPKNLFEEPRKLLSHSRLNGNEELVGIQESGCSAEREQNFISQNKEVRHGPASCLNGNKLCELKPIVDNPTTDNIETVPANQLEVEGDTVKKAVDPQITYPRQDPACTLNSDGFESLTNADDELITSSDTRKSRKRKTKCFRRMKLRWTEEEEVLKILFTTNRTPKNHNSQLPTQSKALASAFELAMSGVEKVVCVTGASGYIASWLVKLLLQRGCTVKATVRDPNNQGTLNVLKSCAKVPSVKRVVIAASMALVLYNGKPLTPDVVVDEIWFSDPRFCEENKENTLSEVLSYRFIDVRDVAHVHIQIQAFENPSSAGRYCLVKRVVNFLEVLNTLGELFPSLGPQVK
ncbi:hypothetical protein PTKIN_Ptkin10aG0043900 [Pterospermum kingtungense]